MKITFLRGKKLILKEKGSVQKQEKKNLINRKEKNPNKQEEKNLRSVQFVSQPPKGPSLILSFSFVFGQLLEFVGFLRLKLKSVEKIPFFKGKEKEKNKTCAPSPQLKKIPHLTHSAPSAKSTKALAFLNAMRLGMPLRTMEQVKLRL